MAETSKIANTTGRRFLRPPSVVSVSRKSQSFNTADRNKTQKEQVTEKKMPSTVSQPSALRAPATSALSSVQSEWRSKSLNAKHSFTTRGIPSSTVPSKLAKNSNSAVENKFKTRSSNSPTHLVKVESSSKVPEPSGKQRLIKMKTSSKSNSKETTSSSSLSKSRPTKSESSMSKSRLQSTAAESSSKLQPPSKSRAKTSSLVPPKASVSRSASNSSRSSSVIVPSPDKKVKSKAKAGSKLLQTTSTKSSTSVLGRLRKLGSPPTTIPNDCNNGVTLKHALPVKSPNEEEKPFIAPTEQKSNLMPPSKLASKGKNAGKSLAPPCNIGTKSSTGIKSTFQRAFGGAKEEKKSVAKTRTERKFPVSQTNSRIKMPAATEEEAEIIAITNSEIPKRNSGEESIYRRDKIDVKDLKHLLVRPYDNARYKKEETRFSSPIVLTDDESNLSDDISQTSCDVEVKEFNKFTHEGQHMMEIQSMNAQMSPRPNYESGVRNIQLPTSSDERKPHKTATVAPFRRQVIGGNGSLHPDSVQASIESQQNNSTEEKMRPSSGSDVDVKSSTKNGEKILSPISVNTNVSMEVRRRTAKGIADLRQNLEETMCSLRNSQLKNRMSDEFERRISAQLDAEVEDIGLPEVPPPLSSNSSYRSTTSISGMHTISLGTRSPKLHAGECFATGSLTSPRPTKYSSLRRPLSGHNRVGWNDTHMKQPHDLGDIKLEDKKANLDDISSVSSEDLSEYIAGVSTDDISLSSTNNSPFHCLKSLPSMTTNNQRSSLSNTDAVNKSTESLEKSSKSSTSESNRSLSSWKKSKTSLNSSDKESKSKKKADKKKNSIPDESGSNAVGSRLATAESPTPIKRQAFACRDTHAYRSLPRPNKSKMVTSDDGSISDYEQSRTSKSKGENFVRSPSLKILLRSKANKSKAKPSLCDIPDGVPVTTSSLLLPQGDKPMSSTPKYGPSEGIGSQSTSHLGSRLNYYDLEKKYSTGRPNGFGLSSTQSLPRRFAKKAGSTTWSTPRSKPNAAYSVPVTPDNLYDPCGSYIENGMPYSDSTSSFSNLTVPDYSGFPEAMSRSFHDRHKISDWPLAGLQPSSIVAASSPNVARAAFNDRTYNYRTISSTHDLRHGSSMSLGGSLNPPNDESSIAMAESFLYLMAQNKAAQQAQMVTEFEKTLSHLTTRLRELTLTAEDKDAELQELRNTIEQLRKQSMKSEDWQCAGGKLKKKPSCGSLSSMSSQTSVSSAGSVEEGAKSSSGKKKRNWLRNSFKTAFGRNKSRTNLSTTNADDADSRTSSPQKHSVGQDAISNCSFEDESCDPETVRKLKEELRQKERKLTDIRLEALTSRHQLEHLQDVMNRMKNEMESLRKENEQLHQLGLSTYTLTSSSTFLHSKLNCVNDNLVKSATDEIKVRIVIEISQYSTITNSKSLPEYIAISACTLPKTLNWIQLDQKIIKIFLAYCQTVDPTNCMKLTKNSIDLYSIGDGNREMGSKTPELLPCGYLVGEVDTIVVKLRDCKQHAVDLLAFELLVDRSIVEKYVALVLERKKIIICGPTGTGKSLLANRLAGYIAKSLSETDTGTVIHLDAKQKAQSELQDFLMNIAEHTNDKTDEATVIVLDNLNNCKQPGKLLEPFSASTTVKNLYLICVTNAKSTSELQDFCWIVCNNNSPPVHSYLARKLRRSYLEHQISQSQKPDDVLSLVITWLPKCWQHINNFLESYNGPDVTIGPRMFSSCPMDAASARVWFTDLWNFSVVPYVISAVKRSLNRKSSAITWSDPTQWVMETMPWRDNAPNLLHINADDVKPSPTESEYSTASLVMSQSSGVTSQSSNATSSSDPLFNMLMRLQEAANYDSDTNSSHDDGFELSIDKALSELGS